ncbi:ATP-binding cassette domain-containing protein [Synechococcus sp. MIT S9508]|uniref:ATP-binding cassette domain-containing protein n=1 Tax=Synechococcus sp. MIT S9508 TaxID=1801629 RepID=UPI002100CA1C|nr:ATP-binding cassette domain-containing protein [Synechococcus sp. MIT S9508]
MTGGQAQRVAIARALIHHPRVLLMDEATSALDPFSQQRINETVQSLGITRISVARRLATIRNADRIIVLRDGVAAESGIWDELKHHGYLAEILAKGD